MYPTWAKYWVLKGLEKMAFNANKKKIIRRKKSTLLDFPEIIPSVFHTTMNCVIQAVENSSQEFLNQDIEFIFSKEYKNSKPDFWDVYGYFYQQSVLNFQSLYYNTQGVWIDYEGIDDSYVLYTSLLEYPVAWCVKSIEYCKRILDQQILSVYYTQDNKGEYCVPRMAILYSENQDSSITIEQFRGVDEYQSLDYFMYKEQSYVDKFLEILNQEEFLVFLEEIYYLINMIESRFKSNNFEICEDNKKIFEALLQEDFLSRFSFISKERLELFLSKTVSKPTS